MSRPIRRYVALLSVLLMAACQAQRAEPSSEAMDNNMAAKADEMEATADNRAASLANDMMTNAVAPQGNDTMSDNATTP